MTAFLIALQFLTIIPVRLKAMPTAAQQHQSMLYYPVVGALLGLVLYAVALLLSGLPTIMLASIILLLWVVLTGGLHLDGLADTADAWVGGYGDPERSLAIMKDPRSGPIGVLSLILQAMMKWSALYVLLQQELILALILFPILGRLSALILLNTTPYVRNNGIAQALATQSSSVLFRLGLYSVMVLSLAVASYWSWAGMASVLIFLLSVFILRQLFIRRVGGITGDLLGATIEITETMVLWSLLIAYLA